MQPENRTNGLTFEAFGVRVRLNVSVGEELERVQAVLPPGSRPCSAVGLQASFALDRNPGPRFELSREGETVATESTLDFALWRLEHELRALIALKAPDHIFVHAGVVGHRGNALLIPGETHAGKTSLVAALLRAGADTYYSDEYAPLDSAGLVHPFSKPLSIRNERFVQVDRHVESLGGVASEEPLPVGAVVLTNFEPGAEWRPRQLSSGEALLAVLAHTVPAQSRPREALRTISRSLERVTALEGTRGEAEDVAPLLLAELTRRR